MPVDSGAQSVLTVSKSAYGLYPALMLIAAFALLPACGEDAADPGDTAQIDDVASDMPNDTGGDSSGDTSEDVTDDRQTDGDTPPADTQETSDASDSAGDTDLSSECDFQGFTAATGSATLDTRFLDVNARTAEQDPADALSLSYQDMDLVQGEVLSFDSTPLPSCNPCMIVQPDCEDGLCDGSFLVTAGEATVSQLGSSITLQLRDITLTEVTIDNELNSTTVPSGRSYCFEDTDITVPLDDSRMDPCVDWPEATLADQNCGTANPLVVNFDASGYAMGFDEVYNVIWDFGDGTSAFGDFMVTHSYSPGEYDVQCVIEGVIAGNSASFMLPEPIKVIAP